MIKQTQPSVSNKQRNLHLPFSQNATSMQWSDPLYEVWMVMGHPDAPMRKQTACLYEDVNSQRGKGQLFSTAALSHRYISSKAGKNTTNATHNRSETGNLTVMEPYLYWWLQTHSFWRSFQTEIEAENHQHSCSCCLTINRLQLFIHIDINMHSITEKLVSVGIQFRLSCQQNQLVPPPSSCVRKCDLTRGLLLGSLFSQ